MIPEHVLAILAKAPLPGKVKTRLAAETSGEFAARVADAFLRDMVGKFRDIAVQRLLAYAPPESKAYFQALGNSRYQLEEQGAGDLGRRLASFVERRFQRGCRRVVVIGADSPTLQPSLVERALVALENADVALGPAADGGYYLIGCAKKTPPLFEGISWGGPTVLAETVQRAKKAGLRIALLEPWYDVDTKADWEMLKGHCRAMRLAGIDPGVPATEALF